MIKFIFLIVFSLFSIATIYSQTKFITKAPGQVIAGQKFQISFILENGDGDDIKLPEFEGMTMLYGPARSQSSQISIINGKATSTKSQTYTFTFSASKEGSYVIPSATIMSEGKQYTSNSVTIKVLPNDGTSVPSQTSNYQVSSEDKTFARMELSKTNVYEQEPILATFKIYTKANIRTIDNVVLPSFEGFVLQDIPIQNPQVELEHYDGVNYQVVAIKKALLYPQKSGKIEIAKADFGITIQTVGTVQGFFGLTQGYVNVEKNISTSPATINVKPLPDGKPSSYANAVGDFKIKSKISKTETIVNDALTYRIIISGHGNLKYIKDPEVKFPADFEVYDPKTELDIKSSTSGVTGSRTIEYTIIPRSAGNFKIPAVNFSYFDLSSKTYKTISTDAYDLVVEKGNLNQGETVVNFADKEELKVLAKDIRYIKTGDFELKKDQHPIFGTIVYWLYYLIPTLLFVLYVLINIKRAKLNSNLELLKNKKANKVASKRLKIAATYLKTYNKDKFYAEVLKTMWGYISDKLTIPLSELSRENVSNELRGYGASDELVAKIMNVIDSCEFAQYAPSQSNEIMDQLYKESVSVISEMESIVK